MKSKLVVGNWKMNGSLAGNQALLEEVCRNAPAGVECGVCVPFPYLAQARALLSDSAVRLGAQDVSEFEKGAYTGEVSASMLADLACHFVIVGHSERRTRWGEDDPLVARKAAAALRMGLTPIVCVGESLAEREAGHEEFVLRRQLDALAEVLDAGSIARLVIAYEPLWAIGTGRAASPEQVQAILSLIRGWLGERLEGQGTGAASVRVLYGGSVNPETAEGLFALPDSDGGLIGGASLVAAQFLDICAAALRASRLGG